MFLFFYHYKVKSLFLMKKKLKINIKKPAVSSNIPDKSYGFKLIILVIFP